MLLKNRYVKYCLYALAAIGLLTSPVSALQDSVVTDRLQAVGVVNNP
jgi:hypothetical protein